MSVSAIARPAPTQLPSPAGVPVRVHAIEVENFRGIRKANVSGFGDVNIVIGRNNSGKSSLMEAICFALGLRGSVQDPLQRDVLAQWRQIRGGDRPSEWFRSDHFQPMRLVVELEKGQGSRRHWGFKDRTAHNDKGAGINEVEQRNPTEDDGPSTLEFIRRATLFRPIDSADEGIETKLWDPLVTHRRDRTITSALNDIFGTGIEHLQIPASKQMQVMYETHALDLRLMGEGARMALRALLMMQASHDCVAIFEEPECFQHRGSLEKLAGALCRMARDNRVQLFVSTHSIECLSAFLAGAEAAGSDGVVIHLKLDDAGNMTARRLDQETVETLQSSGIDVRFLDLHV